MPPLGTGRKTLLVNKRKKNKKAGRGLGFNTSAVRGGDPLPPRLPICLRYSDVRVLTAAANYNGYTYRGNSLFDPDQTGVGSQPVYFDQLSALYQKYRITRFHYEVRVSVTSGTGAFVAIANTNATTAASWASAEAAAGYPGSKSGACGGAGSPPLILKGTCDIGTIYGVPRTTIMSDPSFLALVSANIGNSVYMAICVDTAGATDSFQIATTIYYEGYMETRAYQGLSLTRRRATEEVGAMPTPAPTAGVGNSLPGMCSCCVARK